MPIFKLYRMLAFVCACMATAPQLHAQAPALKFELVHTLPLATDMHDLGLRGPAEVWCEMIDQAQESIDFEQFYAISQTGSTLDRVLEHLEQAAARGVRIRFLMEKKGLRFSDEATLERIRRIPNLQFRLLAYSDITGGIIHAKFFVVDRREAFSGSQNFDWRALEQIDETGLRIADPTMAAQLQAIFTLDWDNAGRIAAGQAALAPTALGRSAPPAADAPAVLVASPARFNPPGVADSEAALVDIFGHATRNIRIAVMEYSPLDQSHHYYGPLDQALRAAAGRGVKVELLVANWNLVPAKLPYLKSLAVLPNIQVRVLTLPQAPGGFIPFARVLHSKIMAVDDHIAWVGSSNWEGGYLDNSRNVEIILRDSHVADQVKALHQQLWHSQYTAPLDVTRDYPVPHPGTP